MYAIVDQYKHNSDDVADHHIDPEHHVNEPRKEDDGDARAFGFLII